MKVFMQIVNTTSQIGYCWLTYERNFQLVANDSGIFTAESIVTYCAPCSVDADFHSALQWVTTSHQTNSTISAITEHSIWIC